MALMPQTPFQWFVPATTGTGMVPAAGYLVKYYAAGTTTPKVIYTDSGLSVPYPSPSNIATLDSAGRALIYLGAGGYKMIICKPDGTPVYTQDNIAGESSFGTGFVSSFASLAGVDTNLNQYTYIGGYYAAGDGGEGMFYNKTSVVAADGGYVQASTFDITKRWFRIPDENGDVRAASFGYTGSGTQSSALLAADSYAYTNSFRVRIQNNNDVRTQSATLNSSVVFDQNAKLIAASGSYTILINGNVEAGGWRIFDGFASASLGYTQQVTRPEWYGAVPGDAGGDADENATAFAAWVAGGGGVFIVPYGSWPITGTFIPATNYTTYFFGSVGSRAYGVNYGNANRITGFLTENITGNSSRTGNIVLTGNYAQTGDQNLNGTFNQTGAYNLTGSMIASGPVTAASFTAEDFITASGVITTIENIAAGKDVVAGGLGAGTAGSLYARAGTSTATFRASGQGQTVRGTGNATLPANALNFANDRVRIICAGTTTNTTPLIAITIGELTVFSVTLATGGTGTFSYRVEVDVFYTGTATSFSTGTATIGTVVSGSIPSGSDSRTAAINWGNSNTISHSASTTNVKTLTMYEIHPAI